LHVTNIEFGINKQNNIEFYMPILTIMTEVAISTYLKIQYTQFNRKVHKEKAKDRKEENHNYQNYHKNMCPYPHSIITPKYKLVQAGKSHLHKYAIVI